MVPRAAYRPASAANGIGLALDPRYDQRMKPNPQGWVLFTLSLPAVVLGYAWMALLLLSFVADWSTVRWQGAGVLTARTRGWAARFWGFSTTLGRAILYHPTAYDNTPEIDSRVERHEFVHLRQWEDACVWAFVGGLCSAGLAAWWGSLTVAQFFAVWGIIWLLSPLTKVTNFVTAVLRHGWKGIYWDTEHERSAFAQTDLIRHLGKSWEEVRDEVRKSQGGIIF